MKPGNLGFISRILRFRCPDCSSIQPHRAIARTIKPRNAYDAHECENCGALLVGYTSFGASLIAFVFFLGPVFVLSGYIGNLILSDVPLLSHFHEARGYREPNFLGFIVALGLFVIPVTYAANLAAIRALVMIEVDNAWAGK